MRYGFKDLKIGAKLAVGAGVALLLITGMAIMGVRSLDSIVELQSYASLSRDIADSLAEIQSDVRRLPVYARDLATAQSRTAIDAASNQLTQASEAAHDRIRKLSEKIPDPDIRAQLQRINSPFARFIGSANSLKDSRDELIGIRENGFSEKRVELILALDNIINSIQTSDSSNDILRKKVTFIHGVVNNSQFLGFRFLVSGDASANTEAIRLVGTLPDLLSEMESLVTNPALKEQTKEIPQIAAAYADAVRVMGYQAKHMICW